MFAMCFKNFLTRKNIVDVKQINNNSGMKSAKTCEMYPGPKSEVRCPWGGTGPRKVKVKQGPNRA